MGLLALPLLLLLGVLRWQLESTEAANQRLLFKHASPQQERAVTFYDELRQELALLLQGRQRLLQELELRALHFSALDSFIGIDVLETPGGVLRSWLLQALQEHPEVEYAEEDLALSAFTATEPNDPNITQQWPMFQLGLFSSVGNVQSSSIQQLAWDRTTGSPNVTVCVIDSGIDYTHPDLQGNIWINENEIPNNGIDDDHNGFVDDYYGYNFLNESGNVMDDNFHGTHLAGIIGAVCNNNIGICGVSPIVKVMACKFLDSNGNGYTSDAIRCMSYALQMGAQVTLNSYGGIGANSQSLQTAVQNSEDAGQLFVTAAGNDYGADIDTVAVYPAAYRNKNVMAINAIDENDQLADYSNFGALSTDLAAPGSRILSTVLNGGYGYHDGTSQAAGFVAGAAALLLAAYQKAGYNTTGTATTIKANILDGALVKPALVNTSVSGGILDIGASMSLVPPSLPTLTPKLLGPSQQVYFSQSESAVGTIPSVAPPQALTKLSLEGSTALG